MKSRVDRMSEKEKLTALLRKYGMDSKYDAPYLFLNQDQVGVVYSFSHPFYGSLARIFYFEDEQEMDDFLYQYWWYKKYALKYHVTMELENYEKLAVKPFFLYQEHSINRDQMEGLLTDSFPFENEKKSVKVYQRYLRTAEILIQIIMLKMKVQQDTYRSVLDLTKKWKQQENEFLHLYNRYQKENKPFNEITDEEEEVLIPKELEELSLQLKFFREEEDKEQLKKFIEDLWKIALSLEIDEGYLQNKYLLIKLPLELEDIRKKINYMENLFNKKKSLFSKKENIFSELEKIDALSETKKIVQMSDYILNEKERISEKYAIIDEMDYATLGDYLNEFDNLGIDCSFEVADSKKDLKYTYEEFKDELKSFYQNYTEEEKHILGIYHSFLQPLCDFILERLVSHIESQKIKHDLISKHLDDIQQSIDILEDSENVFIRMKEMKCLSLQSVDEFVFDLICVCEKFLKLRQFKLTKIGFVFGKSKEMFYEDLHYCASLKSNTAPIQKQGSFDYIDILEISPGTEICYIPTFFSLRDPLFHDYVIEKNTERENIFLFMQNCQMNFLNSDIIKVSKYRFAKTLVDNMVVVKQMTLMKTESYRFVKVMKG